MVWGFATMGFAPKQLLRAVECESLGRLRSFEAQHLSNLLWAFSKTGVRADRLCSASSGTRSARKAWRPARCAGLPL
jgi:hypothetical protein